MRCLTLLRGEQFWPSLPCYCMTLKWNLAWCGGRAEQHMGAGKQWKGGTASFSVTGWVAHWLGHQINM